MALDYPARPAPQAATPGLSENLIQGAGPPEQKDCPSRFAVTRRPDKIYGRDTANRGGLYFSLIVRFISVPQLSHT